MASAAASARLAVAGQATVVLGVAVAAGAAGSTVASAPHAQLAATPGAPADVIIASCAGAAFSFRGTPQPPAGDAQQWVADW